MKEGKTDADSTTRSTNIAPRGERHCARSAPNERRQTPQHVRAEQQADRSQPSRWTFQRDARGGPLLARCTALNNARGEESPDGVLGSQAAEFSKRNRRAEFRRSTH